jgi:hypothetical protein
MCMHCMYMDCIYSSGQPYADTNPAIQGNGYKLPPAKWKKNYAGSENQTQQYLRTSGRKRRKRRWKVGEANARALHH